VPQIPIGPDSTQYVEVEIRYALVNMSMDFLAKTKMRPTPKSTSVAPHHTPLTPSLIHAMIHARIHALIHTTFLLKWRRRLGFALLVPFEADDTPHHTTPHHITSHHTTPVRWDDSRPILP
jgi:hypothetical protein